MNADAVDQNCITRCAAESNVTLAELSNVGQFVDLRPVTLS